MPPEPQPPDEAGGPAEPPAGWSPPACVFERTLKILRGLPEEFNPAVKLDHEITLLEASGRLSLMDLILLRPRLDRAARAGSREIEHVNQTLDILRKLPAEPRRDRPPHGI